MTHFIHTQKQKQLLMKVTLMIMYLNHSTLRLYQTYKNLEEKVLRYYYLVDHNPKRITKADRSLPENSILKKKFPVKIRDTQKIENKNSIGISVFVYENK